MMQAIEDYLAAWNAETSEARQSLLQRCTTPDVLYLDPHLPDPIHGIEELQALMERFRSRFDHRLEPEGKIDMHHQIFRLQWRLQRDNGEMLSRGLMVGDLSETGAIKRIVHFVDPAPPAK